MTAQELLKDKSPIARAAADMLRSGRFGEGMDADKTRWWLQDRGLVSGHTFTDDGERLRKDLRDIERRNRHM